MRLRRDEALSAEAERELEALERALAGDPVDREFEQLAALATDLRAERPAPGGDWSRELDRQVESGFGRAGKPPWRRLVGERRPHSLLAPVGALATLVVVAAVGITVSRDSGDEVVTDAGSGGASIETVAPEAGEESAASFDDIGSGAAKAPPGDASASGDDLNALVVPGARSSADVDARALDRLAFGSVRNSGTRLAPGQAKRIEDRSAALVLQTETPKVREVSDRAISIVEGVGGIVVSSNLAEQGKQASATLELSIPTRSLDSTLNELTDLATVKSLNEGSVDITRPFVSAQDRLADARAEREQLLEALGNATTELEAEAIRKQLDDARGEISRAEAQFENIARRGRLADVSLQIVGKPETDDGSWSLGEAADDALDVLRTLTGVLLVSAAIVIPLGALIAIVTFAAIAIRRRRRERALDA